MWYYWITFFFKCLCYPIKLCSTYHFITYVFSWKVRVCPYYWVNENPIQIAHKILYFHRKEEGREGEIRNLANLPKIVWEKVSSPHVNSLLPPPSLRSFRIKRGLLGESQNYSGDKLRDSTHHRLLGSKSATGKRPP